MNKLNKQIGENIIVEISGKKSIKGLLIDSGSDVIVVYDGKQFIYAPVYHIQNFRLNDEIEEFIEYPEQSPEITQDIKNELSLRKILTQAKGMFVELYVTGTHSIHGYVTSIMNDYFVFYSPVYKSMYVKINHLKWVIPYDSSQRPYDLSNEHLPLQPESISLARTFELQIKKFIEKLVIFDIGEKDDLIGKIVQVDGDFIEVKPAKHTSVYLNLNHIKTLHHVNYA